MKILTSSIALLSSVFLFGSITPSNGENAETPEIRDILGKHAPIDRGAGHAVKDSGRTDKAKMANIRSGYQEQLDNLHREINEVVERRRLKGEYLRAEDFHKPQGNKQITDGWYTPIRFVVDITPLEARLLPGAPANSNAAINAMLDHVIPAVIMKFESLLWVEAPMEPVNLRLRHTNCGSVPLPTDPMINGDFHIIFDGVRDRPMGTDEEKICNDFQNLAGVTETCSFDNYPLNPRAGIVSICLDRVDVASENVVSEEEIQRLVSLYLGEMAVALGATSDLFAAYKDVTTGEPVVGNANTDATCLDGSNPRNGLIPGNVQANTYGNGATFFEITTPTVTQVVRNIFDCQSMTGARLENQPFKPSGMDGTCIGDGWDMRLFHEEVLSNHIDASKASKILSPITLALLEDSGWYMVDYSAAEAVSFGLGAGCPFVEDSCIDASGDLTSSTRGIFCTNDAFEECDPSYKSKAYCNLDFNLGVPEEYQYFPEEPILVGTVDQYDYCPVPLDWLGPCDAGTMCFRKVGEDSLCLEAECVEDEVIFTYAEVTYTCESDFQEIVVAGLLQKIECPRIAAFCPELGCPAACSGRGVCDWTKNIPECSCGGNFKSDGCYNGAVSGSFNSGAGGDAKKKSKKRNRRGRRAVRVRGRRSY